MIKFEHVSKIYSKDIIALDDVSFEIEQGEFMFLVGHSGAGKSTLIRLLIRQETPSSGDIYFEDIKVNNITRSMLPLYRQNIGVVFQDYKLIESKTIKENIEFALEITGKPDNEIKDTTDYLLEVVKLNERANLFPLQLSGGEKQRSGIARALANDPKFLIADEPTGNLDPNTSEEIMEILQKINGWGTTIMIATHDKETVDRMQKRVIRLEKGKIASDIQQSNYNGEICMDPHFAINGIQEGESKKKANSEDKIKNDKAPEILQTSQDLITDDKELDISELDDMTIAIEAMDALNAKESKDSIVEDSVNKIAPSTLSSNLPEEVSIEKIGLPSSIVKILKKAKLKTIGQILDLSEDDLDNIKGMDETKKKLIIHEIERFIKRETEN